MGPVKATDPAPVLNELYGAPAASDNLQLQLSPADLEGDRDRPPLFLRPWQVRVKGVEEGARRRTPSLPACRRLQAPRVPVVWHSQTREHGVLDKLLPARGLSVLVPRA